MYCRNFFKFALICSAFSMLFGLPVMANEVATSDEASVVSDAGSVEIKKETNSSDSKEEGSKEQTDSAETDQSASNEEDQSSDEDVAEISLSIDVEKPIKGIQIQVRLDPKNVVSTDSDSSPVSDGVLEKKLKDRVQEKKDILVATLKNYFSSIKNNYSADVIQKLLDRMESWEIRAGLVKDNDQKIWRVDLASPITVQNTNLLEKTPLDESNSNFVEINLINK